jgi:hypothetical protein
VLDDLKALHKKGVTEAFLDLNFSPNVDVAYADRVLDAFAPG